MEILITRHFVVQAKKLKKKYPHLKDDLINALENSDENKEIHIGKSIYKIRIKSSDINKGKSGGLRSYIYVYRKKDLIVPLCIYSKSEVESISQSELEYHFENTAIELAKINL